MAEAPRIAVVTGRRAAAFVRSIVSTLTERSGLRVEVVEAPIEVVSLMPKELAERVIRGLNCHYDIVILPGTLPYEPDDLEVQDCVTVVKGPLDPSDLLMLAEVEPSELVERLRRLKRITPEVVVDKWLEELREHHLSTPSVHVCGARVPERPPPVAVAAEVYVRQGEEGRAVEAAKAAVESGADLVVLGFPANFELGRALEVVRAASREAGGVGVDTPNKKLIVKAFEEGYACLALSAGEGDPLLQMLPRGSPVVVIPVYSDYSMPSTVDERVNLLARLVDEAHRRGLVPIADPLVDPPGFGFARSVAAYLAAAERVRAPLMAGIANVYELIDADSHGQIAVLAQLYAEAGASILLVTEESWKTQRAVSEAAIAATMAGLSLLKRKPPKDLGISLLYVKEKRPKSGVPLPSKPDAVFNAETLASWYGFRLDKLGNHLINVEGGIIRDVYIGRRGTIEVRGTRAEDLYKAIAYLGLASEPTHYAYLGCELCKAELALRLGISYEQEKPLLSHPSERTPVIYSVRREGKHVMGRSLRRR